MSRQNLILYTLCSTIIAWTHPLVMATFAALWTSLPIDAWLAIPGFVVEYGNTKRINLSAFLPVGSLLYFAWIRAQVIFFSKRRPQFRPSRFLTSKALGSIPVCAVGAVNLAAWVRGTQGRLEYGLLLVPVVLVSILSVALWISQLVRARRGRFDDPRTQPPSRP
jgi:hypothetical protein